LSDTEFSGAPGLVAGKIKHKLLGKHQIAYAFISRARSDLSFFSRIEIYGDIALNIPGDELFQGTIDLGKKVKEEWIGLSWAYPISDKFSIGLSNFYTIRSQRANYELRLQAFSEFGQVAVLTQTREYSYKSRGLLWKLGLSLNLKDISMGFTVRAPKLHLNGDGDFLYEDFLVGVDTTGDGNTDDIFISDFQDDLDSKHRSPWAIGFGTGIKLGKKKKTTLHLSVEWFDRVSRYSILESEPFIGQSSGDTIHSRLVDDLKSVINFGAGIEYYLNEKLSVFGSYSTNFSPVRSNVSGIVSSEEETNNTIVRADFNNTSFGFVLKANRVELNLGAGYTFGKDTFSRPIDFPEDAQGDIFKSDEGAVYRLEKWRFFVGVSIPFVDKVRDELGI